MSAFHPPANVTGIQSRSSAVLHFAALLDDEREAAKRADVETLVVVQEQKRAALEALRGDELTADDRSTLQQRAQRNLRLIRQLVRCFEGMLMEPTEGTYDAQGARTSMRARGLRGLL